MDTDEQRQDIVRICYYFLSTILWPFSLTDDTPDAPMIAQLRWLKEQAEMHTLRLPLTLSNWAR